MDQMNYSPQTPMPTPAPAPVQPVYAKGCIGAAWEDIKTTPGYVGKLLVLGLIMCVPILNFVVAGYLLHWSREVPFGGKTPMPAKYVTGKNFEFGFYAFVIALAVGIVTGVIGMVLGFIPLLGGLAYLAVMVAGTVAINVMQMRMIMGYTIGDGFNVKDVWNMAKRNWGQLLLVTLVPNIVAGLIVGVVTMVITLFAVLVAVGGAAPSMVVASASDPSFAEVMAIVGAIAVPTLIAVLIVYVLACFVEAAAQAVTVRGLGHWVARYAPEWTALSVPVPPATPTYPQTPFPPQAS
ncbi:hypothetical protein VJ918_10430 [Adlercreutzia sp. R21]|uniref:DUF4013 domain-containing protein n=1 Tax=Adlercreutzia wanghongyangiae TaxID=3111451 RepID=A0ABU6IKG9_9ACTN|nr:hypothetical protein [Adlercreutzia sp. R21]MEC4176963.1 hypothetical protein [Adlercreutzia sp. R7]MEC4185226.1 hypothetical protein [Adlercreutzia sp. R21]